jgi:hypothetical protein
MVIFILREYLNLIDREMDRDRPACAWNVIQLYVKLFQCSKYATRHTSSRG